MSLLSFGDYGYYVWSAYSLTGLIFVGQVVSLYYEKRRLRKKLQRFILKKSYER